VVQRSLGKEKEPGKEKELYILIFAKSHLLYISVTGTVN
jgi:hypothetical protein